MALTVIKNQKEERILQVGSNKFELVDFRLYDYNLSRDPSSLPDYEGIYGINIAKVKEINKFVPLTKIPNCHPCVEGVLELRNEAIPIINLAKFLGYKNTTPQFTDNIIICDFNSLVTGFIVHHAAKIRRVSWESILPPTKLTRHDSSCITGMYKIEHSDEEENQKDQNDLMLLIIDFEKIVAEINGEAEILNKYEHDKRLHKVPTYGEGSKTVLVVDDSSTARTKIEMLLSHHGYQVITMQDGEQALSALENLHEQAVNQGKDILDFIQLVITDVEMPRMDGHAFIQILRKDNRFANFPVLMNSSLSGHSNMERGKNLANEYLVKFDSESIINCVNKLWLLSQQIIKSKKQKSNEL
ncbi:MAG: chemotaxis protein [Silvanigrellaceae bacterium]|nr:chemotaxis protein [Silvanigrellaceae bacterium]